MDIMEVDELQTHTIQARFVSDSGEEAGPPIDLPISVDVQQLELICNAILKNVSWLQNIVFLHFLNNFLNFRKIKHLICFSWTKMKSRKDWKRLWIWRKSTSKMFWTSFTSHSRCLKFARSHVALLPSLDTLKPSWHSVSVPTVCI